MMTTETEIILRAKPTVPQKFLLTDHPHTLTDFHPQKPPIIVGHRYRRKTSISVKNVSVPADFGDDEPIASDRAIAKIHGTCNIIKTPDTTPSTRGSTDGFAIPDGE
jgi:hypothetical protein